MAHVQRARTRPGSRRDGAAARAPELHLHLLEQPPGVLHGARRQPDRPVVSEEAHHRLEVRHDARRAARRHLRALPRAVPHPGTHLRKRAETAVRARRVQPAPRRPRRRAARLPVRLRAQERDAVPVAADHQLAPSLPSPGERRAVRGTAPQRGAGREEEGGEDQGRRKGAQGGEGEEPRSRGRDAGPRPHAAPMPARDRAAGRRTAVHPAGARHRDGGERDILHVRHQAHERHLRHPQRRPRRHRGHRRERRGLPRAHEAHPQEALPPGSRAARKRAPAVPHPGEAAAQALEPQAVPSLRHQGSARHELHVRPGRPPARGPARRADEHAVHAAVAGLPRPQPPHHRPGDREGSAAVVPLREHGRLRAAAARGRERRVGHLHQDHAVPPGQPVASGRGAHRRGRERQGSDRPVRAARPLRREQQHRVVAAL